MSLCNRHAQTRIGSTLARKIGIPTLKGLGWWWFIHQMMASGFELFLSVYIFFIKKKALQTKNKTKLHPSHRQQFGRTLNEDHLIENLCSKSRMRKNKWGTAQGHTETFNKNIREKLMGKNKGCWGDCFSIFFYFCQMATWLPGLKMGEWGPNKQK